MDIRELNNLLDKAINLQKKQRRRTVIVVIILAMIGGGLFYGSNFFTAKTVAEKIEKDSSITNPVYINVQKKQHEDLYILMDNYFHARKNKDLENVSKYYADTTFEYFYSHPNLRNKYTRKLLKKDVVNIDKIDFRSREVRDFDFNDIISFSTLSECKGAVDCDLLVFVNGKQFSRGSHFEAILEIKLRGRDKKIYSIRPYIDDVLRP